MAIEPLRRASSGWSPPSAPPIRTWFQVSATPRLLPPKMSMPLACPIARISRESLTASFSMPTKYLHSPMPCLYIRVSSGGLLGCDADAHPCGDLYAPAGFHPLVDLLRVQHDFAHVGIEAEEAVGHAQRVERVAHRAHAAHQ